MKNKLVVFKNKQIRRTLHNNEWWFSVADTVADLTNSVAPKQYIKRMRQRDTELNSYWGTICTPLALKAPDGKMRKTNCANTEGLFRIIQSIPSPKAEPFKRWLAKGYSKAWIENRMLGIAVWDELTDEWQKRGIKENPEYAILTAEISKATFITPV